MAMSVLGCAGAAKPSQPDAGPSSRATAAEPQQPSGMKLTVAGPVRVVVDAYVFAVGEDGSRAVVVLVPGGAQPLQPGDHVEVTGTLRPFDVAAVEAEFAILLDRHRLADFRGQPVLIATLIRKGDPGG